MSFGGSTKKKSATLAAQASAAPMTGSTETTNQSEDPANATSAPTAPGVDPNAEKDRVEKSLSAQRSAQSGGFMSTIMYGTAAKPGVSDVFRKAYRRMLG